MNDCEKKTAQRRENILGVVAILTATGLATLMIANYWWSFKFFKENTKKALSCETADELRRAVPAEWLRERPFVKDGKQHLRISVYIKPPKLLIHPLAPEEPAFIFDSEGRKIDQCLREYDACDFRPRWRESYDTIPKRATENPKTK